MTHAPMWLKEALALALARLKEALALALMPLKGALAMAPVRLKQVVAPAPMPLGETLALSLTRLKEPLDLGLRRKETHRQPCREPCGLLEAPADVGNATLVVFQQLSVESIWEFVSLRMANTHRR